MRPGHGTTFEDIGTLAIAQMEGLVTPAMSMPRMATRSAQAQPFGAATSDSWSLPALGLASLASAFLEPDPEITWDEQRLAYVRHALGHPLPRT